MTLRPPDAPTILILEDEAVVALELEMRLRKLGYRIQGPVATFADAVTEALASPPSLLLADVRIGSSADGIDVARALRDRLGVPTVFLSAHSDPNTLRRIVESSPFGYLTKPFREAELHGTLQTALMRARLERELEDRERRLREAYRVGNLGHWELDLDTRLVHCSAEVSAMLGLPEGSSASLPHASFLDRLEADAREEAMANVEAAAAGSLHEWTHGFRIEHPERGARHIRAFCAVRHAPPPRGAHVVGVAQDVTDLERAAAATREREERARIADAASGDAEWDWSPEAGRITFSARWKSMLGLGDGETEDSVSEWHERIHPDDRAAVFGALSAHVEGRTPFYVNEHRIRAKGGHYVHVLDRGKVVERTPEGRPRRIIGTHTDISELRRAELEAREAQLRYRRLFEQAGVGVAEIDARSGRITRANGRFATVLRYRPGELDGRILTGMTHPEDRADETRAIAEVVAASPMEQTIEKRALDSQGGVVWLQQTISLLDCECASDVRVVCVVQDVTGRRVAELQRTRALDSLERTTRELDALLSALPDALFRLDHEGRVLHRRLGRLLPDAAIEERLRADRLDAMFRGVGLEALRARLSAALLDRLSGSVEFELEGTHGPRAYEGRLVPFSTNEALLILRDITEQHAATRRLREREEQLCRAQHLESVGRLAGGIAHDFNNLLSIIVGTGALLEPLVANVPEGTTLLRDILDASERAAGLTQQLLAFSRKQVVDPRPVDVNQRILSFSRLMERTLGPDIVLVLRLSPVPAVVLVDPSQFEQMLLNLVVNARDAMPDGGRLELWTSVSRRVETAGAADGGVVRIRVRDSGTGINPSVLPNIFEPFFTTKEVGQGTGLGLSTVHGIVHQAGGKVSVQSRPGCGTSFEITLPIADAMHDVAPRSARSATGGEHVLVVDDERSVRRLTAELLERAGYRVTEAADGIEALSTYRGDGMRFDAVVTDLIMPRLGGLALARELRRDAPNLAVLFLSGYGEDAESVRALGPVLVKPFTPDRLYAALGASLGPSRG